MSVDPFAERLAKVRQRFVSTLEGQIEDTFAAIPHLSGNDLPAAVEAIEESYRRIHGLVGIGPTVGFASTGQAARAVEHILLPPRAAERGLTIDEMTSLKRALQALREAAVRELQTFYSGYR